MSTASRLHWQWGGGWSETRRGAPAARIFGESMNSLLTSERLIIRVSLPFLLQRIRHASPPVVPLGVCLRAFAGLVLFSRPTLCRARACRDLAASSRQATAATRTTSRPSHHARRECNRSIQRGAGIAPRLHLQPANLENRVRG